MASKITIKRSLTAAAPAGLSFGEMAFVQGSGLTANQLYVGISGGSPAWVGAQIGTTGTWTDTSAQTSLATQYAIEQRITSKISASTAGVSSFNGVTGAVTGVSSFNGLTGAVSGVTTSVANTFTALQTFSAGISVSGATFTGLISGATATFSKDITVNSIPIGRGLGDEVSNTGVGVDFLQANTSGTNNVGVGYRVFRQNTTGSDNVAIGYAAFNTNTSGSGNVGVGYYALGANTSGSNKTAIGHSAGRYRGTGIDATTTGTGGIYIGYQARASAGSLTNEIVIGVDALGLGSHTAVIGATLQSSATIYGVLNLPSGLSTTGATFTGNISAPNIVSSFNGLTGAVSGLTSGGPLGTPSSGTLTNCTGLPVGTGISGLGGNVAAFLATPSSANLAAALTDETGSGANVFASSPTLVTPTLGVAAATSINKVTITTPATGSTITVADGKTLTASNTLTFTGTDASSVAFGAGGTVVYTSGLGTNVAAFLATPSSANLISAITDETGTGALVFANTPTLVTPKIAQINDTNGIAVLKTAATASAVNEVTITNNITAQAPHVSATGTDTNISLHLSPKGTGKYVVVENGTDGTKQIAIGVAGAATATTTYFNAAQTVDRTITLPDATGTVALTANKLSVFAATTSSELLGVISDETGTGALVFANTPTLVTPNIGAATGTSLVLSGDLTVNGTTTNINTTNLVVEDKNIVLGDVTTPSDATADGGGITLKGLSDKTLNWVDATDAWTSSEHFNLLTGKAYYINGASVLNATTLGSAIVTSSLTSVGILTSLTVSGTLDAGLIDCGTF